MAAALEDYTSSTDTLLGQWYMHRRSRSSAREQYNMDSVRFTTDVPDSVLMRRLADMNSFISLPYNETVKNYMILYSEKMPRKMGEMMGLSEYYMPIYEETFRRYDLPVELKYLAVIESALNPRAESRVGALGLWQFMYRTAKSYGLRIDSYVDERMDPVLSADAAARYLRDAYRIFRDWPLAISSYNCGSGNVNKAIKRAGGKKDFWSIYDYLPRETRGYVPAMVGAMYAFRYANEYGLYPEPMAIPTYVDTIHLHKNLHFAQVSEAAGNSLGRPPGPESPVSQGHPSRCFRQGSAPAPLQLHLGFPGFAGFRVRLPQGRTLHEKPCKTAAKRFPAGPVPPLRSRFHRPVGNL